MAMRFNKHEKLALYVFGCANLERTLGNINGAFSLCEDSVTKKELYELGEKLAYPEFYQEEYEKLFYQVRTEVSKVLTDNHLLYQKITGDVENTFPCHNFVKAIFISCFCGKYAWDSMLHMRMVLSYVTDPKMKKIMEEAYDTIYMIASLEDWNYEEYIKRYKAIVHRAKTVYRCIGVDGFYQHIWEVKDVELE